MKKVWFLLISMCFVVSCDDVDDITSEEMVEIITESLLTNSIISANNKLPQPGTTTDTIDYYAPILAKYGYTIDDFRYTIREMSSRKSNPLNEIFGQVSKRLDSLAAVAEYNYGAALRYDTLALNFYADTVYRKDTTIRGSLKKYKFSIKKPQIGDYTIIFDYHSVSDYRSGTKALTHRLARRGDRKISPPNREWLNRAIDTSQFKRVIKVSERGWDSLVIGFEEPVISKKFVKQFKDTSFIRSVVVIHTPAIERARQMYYHRYFEGIKLYEIIKNEKDSLPLPFGR